MLNDELNKSMKMIKSCLDNHQSQVELMLWNGLPIPFKDSKMHVMSEGHGKFLVSREFLEFYVLKLFRGGELSLKSYLDFACTNALHKIHENIDKRANELLCS